MPIKVRLTADPKQALSLGIERLGDNAVWDWNAGKFVPFKQPMPTIMFSEDYSQGGKYSIEAPHQQLLQFADSPDCCFWLFKSGSGCQTPQDSIYSQGGKVTLPHTNYSDYLIIRITEPTTAI